MNSLRDHRELHPFPTRRSSDLRIHYRTIGKPVKDTAGVVRNAVLIGHGTGGEGGNFLGARFESVLFGPGRSEEHTSELQSLRHLVCRLLLEKKKNIMSALFRD